MNKPRLASERLMQKVSPFKGDSIGIATEHIAKLSLTVDVVEDIFECLRSADVSELKWGLWFAFGVLDSNPPKELLRLLVTELPKWMDHHDGDVRQTSLSLLLRLRENFSDYRSMMLKCLKDPSPDVRADALAAYQTFLTKNDIPVLLDLQQDNFMSETEMGSPLVYAIRNQALAVIEALCQQQFTKAERVEMGQAERMVYWWDWQPFLEWWSKHKSKRHFWT